MLCACSCYKPSYMIQSEFLTVPCVSFAELKDLNIENCRKLTDLSLDHLRKHAPKLQVSQCPCPVNTALTWPY